MSLPDVLRNRVDSSAQFECRSCGETLEELKAACPGCGSQKIAEYTV